MNYDNAKNLLPEDILKQVQKYAAGKLIYVPVEDESKAWGEASGYRKKLMKRNLMICNKYASGVTISELADEYFLSLDSIKKIIYCKKDKALIFSNSLSSAIHYANAGLADEWIQSYFMFYTNEERRNEYLQKEFIIFGLAKIPLRLIRCNNYGADCSKLIERYGEIVKETEPFIVRFENGCFFVDMQEDLLSALKGRKVNAYPAFILISYPKEYKKFMKYYGNHFIMVEKL